MKLQSSSKYLFGTASVLALLASAASTTPVHAQVSKATRGLYFGGSTLASEAFRQIIDCYNGSIVGSGTQYSDGFTFTSSTGPGKLPTACTVSTAVNILYAGVGSGNGVRGYIANNPQQWYGGTINPLASSTTTTSAYLPALQPSLIDLANPGSPSTRFGSYPYPHVDAGLSDSPLAIASGATTLTTFSIGLSPTTGWMIPGSPTTTYTTLASLTVASGSTAASYDTTNFGAPIQVPAFEVNVAIAVNLQDTSVFTINSKVAGTGVTPGTQANQGAAIQLGAAELCAIFSGLVTDWSDVTANKIAYIDSSGTQHLTQFNFGNVSGSSTPAYANTSKAIKVVYRSDGSGTSFILTNYLHAVCPLLDSSGSLGYKTIFGNTNLPSTSFQTLINNINADTTHRPNGSTTTATWIGASGSGGVASNVSDDTSTNSGHIGYVSADFTRPYTTQIAVSGGTVGAPYSAALQNENLRIGGTYVPNNTSGSLTFIAPTPVAAGNAWGDLRLQIASPSTTWTWANYNIYNNTFVSTPPTTTQVIQGGVNVTGLSVLPLTNQPNAYPLSGTTFLDLYTCYKNVAGETAPTRTQALTGFLNWYYGSATTLNVTVMQNAGFNPIPATLATNIRNTYLAASASTRILAAGTASTACASATGAN